MHSRGINTLISDSGVIRYRLVAEEWDIYNNEPKPTTWKFMKGMLMERFDEKFHIDLFVQSDTSYLHEQRLWELRGRVVVRNVKGDVFHTEELFWDMNKHEMWSNKYIRINTPERELEGTEFHSNEQMTQYYVINSVGAFPVEENQEETAVTDTTTTQTAEAEQQNTAEQPTEQRGQQKAREKGAPMKLNSVTSPTRFPAAPGKYDNIKQD